MTVIHSSRQSGFTLLEVLVSIFVVLVGLLGVASMIPAGRFEMTEARKLDMGSNISRALLQSVVAQLNKLDKDKFSTGKSYMIAPTDVTTTLQPVMKGAFSDIETAGIFNDIDLLDGNDDVIAAKDGDNKTILYGESDWSNSGSFDSNSTTGTGDYQGFATVIRRNNGYYEVTAAVKFKSNDISDNTLYGSVGLTGFNTLTGFANFGSTTVSLERGQYVLVKAGSEIHWYRIEFAAYDGSSGFISLSGPAWRDSSSSATLYAVGRVVSVSSRIVRLGE